MANKAIKIENNDTDIGRSFRSNTNKPQRQDIPEADKTPQWFYRNAMYYLTFYNKPVGSLRFDSTPDTEMDIPEQERLHPAQHMIRMMMYYLGKQPNLDYAYLTQNPREINKQASWVKGQDVSKFINHFRGLIQQRLTKANWTAQSVSREATNRYTEMYEKLEVATAMAPFLKEIEQKYGIGYKPLPNAPEIEIPEDIERVMDTSFYEEGSMLAGDLANGFWHTNGWAQKALKSFMHTTITSHTAWWHIIENGRLIERLIMPYQLLYDNRHDDDYGAYDEFRGVIESMNAYEATQQRSNGAYSPDQIDDIYEIAGSNDKKQALNSISNIHWWPTSGGDNQVTRYTVYWRTRREVPFGKFENRFKNQVIRKRQPGEQATYVVNDIAFATILGDTYLENWGYIDNLVESIEDPSRPEFPIQRFRPNTFLGESISEVSRIAKLQDEMDMLDFQIKQMIGRSKGKVYVIHGDKLGDGASVKDMYEDFSDMGIHVTTGVSGEPGDPNDRKSAVEVVDMTLDPNIHRLVELRRGYQDLMGQFLNTSVMSLGQQTRYIGYGQQQNAIAQNQVGISYLIDGFLDFLVMNMRYAANRAKNLYSETEEEVPLLIGDKGMRWIKFTKGMRFESFMLMLNINDSIDEEGRKRILSYAQAWSQNPSFGISPVAIMKIEKAKSYTEAADILEYDLKQGQKQTSQSQQSSAEMNQQMKAQSEMFMAALEQLKQDNANFREMLKVGQRASSEMASMTPPSVSPLGPQLAAQTQQAQQPQQPQEQPAQQ